jgi:hypothetical protein
MYGVQGFDVVVEDDAGGDEDEGEDVPFDDGVDEY